MLNVKDIGCFEALHSMEHGYKKEILVESDYVYISALNSKSALKRYKSNKGSATKPDSTNTLSLY